MNHRPQRQQLPDHASERDERAIPIDAVGIRRLQYPVGIRSADGQTQHTVAEIDMAVALPGDARGTHMSRFIEVLNAHRGAITPATLLEMVAEMRRRLETPRARLTLSFPYFIDKAAPVSGVRSLMSYTCALTVISDAEAPTPTLTLEVGVPVKSLCPCSKAISDYGAHNQRSEVRVKLQGRRPVSIESVVDAVEGAASAPLFALLKREDEKWVTEYAYDNPRFVEDLVREVLLELQALDGVESISVSAENFESIHNHSAYAELTWRRDAEPPQSTPSASEEMPSEPLPFGQWLRRLRQDLGMRQSELAQKVGCSTSFLSKVEHGTKAPGEACLGALAEALGQDPLKLYLRAGVIPAELLARVQADPEGFLAWASAR
ncbi:MAG: GTP cyclohydrolase FolE2 [Bradymonadia bacterium]